MITRKKIYTCLALLFCASKAAFCAQQNDVKSVRIIDTKKHKAQINGLSSNTTIEELKKRIKKADPKWNVPIDRQRLVFKGNQLKDNKATLGACDITGEAPLRLVIIKNPRTNNNNLDLPTSLLRNPKPLIIIPILLLLGYLVVRFTTKKKAPKHDKNKLKQKKHKKGSIVNRHKRHLTSNGFINDR